MTKLTLSIDERVIYRAKNYAKKSKRSLSEIVESYLEIISSSEESSEDDELNKIKGIIFLDKDFNEKEEIRNILSQKYL